MSQSDYLKQKKMNHVVKSELPQVLSSENYTNYKDTKLFLYKIYEESGEKIKIKPKYKIIK